MGLVGFLDFVLKCIQLLAWPSVALGYPLCASIVAIETNSNLHMRKLVAYWIFFSLISLFEFTFSKLLEWFPVWPYVKILAIFWLVMPGFDGASIAYDNIVRPCLSMQLPQIIVDMLNKKQYVPLTRESFLEEAEKYVKENGTEALEKLFASKPMISEPPVAQKDIQPVEILDINTAAAENKITTVDTDIEVNNTTLPEKLTENAFQAPPAFKNVQKEWTSENAFQAPPAFKNVQKEWTSKNAFQAPPAFKNVQKEWTCAVCQVTTQSEATLNSHLRGIKHRTKCEELNAGKQTATKKGVSTGTPNKERNCTISQVTTQSKTTWTSLQQEFIAGKQTATKNNLTSTTIKSEPLNQDLKKVSSGSGINKVSCANQDPKKSSSESGPNNKFGCDLCQVKLHSEATLKSHLQGAKHKSKSEQLKARGTTEDNITSSAKYSDKNSSALNKNLSAITEIKIKANVSNGSHSCSICNVTCTSESDMASHLRGKRHLSQIEDSVHTGRVHYWCDICDVKCLSEIDMASHLNGKTHDSNLYESD